VLPAQHDLGVVDQVEREDETAHSRVANVGRIAVTNTKYGEENSGNDEYDQDAEQRRWKEFILNSNSQKINIKTIGLFFG